LSAEHKLITCNEEPHQEKGVSTMTGKSEAGRKSYEITKDGFVRVYPSIDHAAERAGRRAIVGLLNKLLKRSASQR